MNKYYKVMPIDVMPEESGEYDVVGLYIYTAYFCAQENQWFVSKHKENRISLVASKHWHKPITLTLKELLQTDEGKEIIREVFQKAISRSFASADDFINNTNP
jgi:hypothetical protein